MFNRFLGTSALLAAGWLATVAGLAPAQTPPATRCPVETSAEDKLLLIPYQVTELVETVGAGSKTREADLIKTIQETIAPKSWASHGGRGTMDYYPMTMTLVVNQTPDVQEMIAGLLTRMVRGQDTQVVLEVRLVTVPGGFFERIGVDFNAKVDHQKGTQNCAPTVTSLQNMPTGFINDFAPDHFLPGMTPAPACTALFKPITDSKSGMAFLNDSQVVLFLEGVQGEQRANVMQAPKITTLDGQMAHVDCTEKQPFVTGCEVIQRDGQALIVPKTEDVVTGFRISACPKVSADRRFVEVKLDINKMDLASAVVPLCPVTVQIKDDQGKPAPFTQYLQQPKVNTVRIENTVTIPDGGTMLIGGLKKEIEVRHEDDTPVLSRVPYVNRLFKNVGYGRETQMVYVLVTPRIVVPEEEEPRQTGIRRECTEECEPPTVAAPSRQAKVVAELLTAYDEACAAGQKKEAARFARAALTIDPACFAKRSER